MPAFQPATTFARNADYDLIGGYLYARNGSPNVSHIEALMAELEGGAASLFFASGMAAVAAVIDTLDTGQRVSAPAIMYHGVKTWLLRQQSKRGIGLDLFDVTDGGALARSITPGKTAIVWIETPVNPTWDIVDIAAAAEAAHAGRRHSRGQFDLRPAADDPAPGAWRRHRLPLRDQISQRPQRRDGGRAHRQEP